MAGALLSRSWRDVAVRTLLGTIGADAVAEFGSRMIVQIAFNLLPDSCRRANLFAPGADGDHAAEAMVFLERQFELLDEDCLRLFRLPALGEDTGQGQGRHRQNTHERLQRQERRVQRCLDEGTVSVGRAPDRDPRRQHQARHRSVVAKSERGPYHQGNGHKRQGALVMVPQELHPPKDEESHAHQQAQQEPGFCQTPGVPNEPSRLAPAQDQRSHDDDPHGVAKPPGPPIEAVPGPRGEASQHESCDADRGGNQADENRNSYKLEYMPESVEGNAPADPDVQQVAPQHGLQRGPCSDGRRHPEVSAQRKLIRRVEEIPQIGQESPQPDSRPDAVAIKQKQSQCDPRRRPHRRSFLLWRHGQRQPESRRRYVEGGCGQEQCQGLEPGRQRSESRRNLSLQGSGDFG